MAADVRLLHLATGEDIIGRVSFDSSTSVYTVEKPVSPHMTMDPTTGSVRVGLMPIRPYASEDVATLPVSALHVVYVAPLADQMLNAYTQFTSDIQIADASTLSSLLKG